jgi:hypothetical protein
LSLSRLNIKIMKKKNIALSVGFLAIMALLGGVFASMGANGTHSVMAGEQEEASVSSGNFGRQFGKGMMRGMSDEDRQARFEEMEQKHSAVREALEKRDYQAWQKAAGTSCPMAEKVNQENFDKFAEAHGYIYQGRDMLTEMGIEKGGKMGKMGGKGMCGGVCNR